MTRGWAIVASTGVARLGLGFVASLLIARALGPTDFGVYAVLAATVGIVGGLAEGGLTEAAVLRISAVWARQPRLAVERARVFFWLRIGLAALVVAVGCLLASPVAQRMLNVDEALLRWALLGIVATAMSGAVSGILQATGAFGRMSSLTLVNAGLTAVLAVALAVVGRLDLVAALVVLGIGTSLATFVFGRAALPKVFSLTMPSGGASRGEGRALFATGRWLWLASLFAMLTANTEVLLLDRFAALPVVGAYALALNLASKADIVNHSLYTVLLPGVAALRSRAALKSYARRGLIRGLAIAAAMLVLIPLVPLFINVFYGGAFAASVPLLQFLLVVQIFDVLVTPFLLLPLAFRQARLLAAADAARAITLVLVALLAIPTYGAVGAIAARFAARLVGAVLVAAALWLTRTTLQVQHEEAAPVA